MISPLGYSTYSRNRMCGYSVQHKYVGFSIYSTIGTHKYPCTSTCAYIQFIYSACFCLALSPVTVATLSSLVRREPLLRIYAWRTRGIWCAYNNPQVDRIVHQLAMMLLLSLIFLY